MECAASGRRQGKFYRKTELEELEIRCNEHLADLAAVYAPFRVKAFQPGCGFVTRFSPALPDRSLTGSPAATCEG